VNNIYSKSNNGISYKVGLLIGDFMEKLQVKYEEEIKKKAEIDGLPVPMMRAPKLEEIKEDNKYAGFFGN
jgi:hypothetical protein